MDWLYKGTWAPAAERLFPLDGPATLSSSSNSGTSADPGRAGAQLAGQELDALQAEAPMGGLGARGEKWGRVSEQAFGAHGLVANAGATT